MNGECETMLTIAFYQLDPHSIKKIINFSRRYCWDKDITHKFITSKDMNNLLNKICRHRIDILFLEVKSDISGDSLAVMRQYMQIVYVFNAAEQPVLPAYTPEDYLEKPIGKENLRTIFEYKLVATYKLRSIFTYESEGKKHEIEKRAIVYMEYSEKEPSFIKKMVPQNPMPSI